MIEAAQIHPHIVRNKAIQDGRLITVNQPPQFAHLSEVEPQAYHLNGDGIQLPNGNGNHHEVGILSQSRHEAVHKQIIRRKLQEVAATPSNETPSSSETREEQFITYALKLNAIKAAAEGYALWAAQREFRPAFEGSVKVTEDYRDTKKQTIQALLELDKVLRAASTEQERTAALNQYRHFWGENSGTYESMYQNIQHMLENPPADTEEISAFDAFRGALNNGVSVVGQTINEKVLRRPNDDLSEDEITADPKVKNILLDREIPWENKKELLVLRGYPPAKAAKIAAGLGISVIPTFAFKAGGDYGAIIIGAIAQGRDIFQDLPTWLQMLLTGASWGGYHVTARQYGKACVRILRDTGFSLNTWASSTFHALAFRPKRAQELATERTVSGVEVFSDLYMGFPSMITQDPTFFFTVNAFGIGLTAGQIALSEGMRQGFKIHDRLKNKSVEEKAKALDSSVIWVNPKVKRTTSLSIA